MKKFTAFLLLLLLLYFLLPVHTSRDYGVYNPLSGLMWCRYTWACIHEIGHKLDDRGGWISHTQKFNEAIYIFVASELIAHDTGSYSYILANTILRVPGSIGGKFYWWDRQSEIYATIFQSSDGKIEKMPEIFRPFYNWEDAERLLKKYKKYP
jgi:hypothetical protein